MTARTDRAPDDVRATRLYIEEQVDVPTYLRPRLKREYEARAVAALREAAPYAGRRLLDRPVTEWTPLDAAGEPITGRTASWQRAHSYRAVTWALAVARPTVRRARLMCEPRQIRETPWQSVTGSQPAHRAAHHKGRRTA